MAQLRCVKLKLRHVSNLIQGTCVACVQHESPHVCMCDI